MVPASIESYMYNIIEARITYICREGIVRPLKDFKGHWRVHSGPEWEYYNLHQDLQRRRHTAFQGFLGIYRWYKWLQLAERNIKDMNESSQLYSYTTWAVENLKLKKKKNQAWTGFKPLTSVILVQWYQYIAMGKQWFLNLTEN